MPNYLKANKSTGETARIDRDWTLYETILSGDINTPDVNTDNSYHVVKGADRAVLDGFTITGGNADPFGGGIYCYQASPTIRNCTIEGNYARVNGGGMYNYLFCSPIVTNCFFSGNYASEGHGGGMYNYASSALITNCTFSGNKAGRNGGGIYNLGTVSPTLINCTFSGNVAHYGGGMYNFAVSVSPPTVTNCIFWGNEAVWDGNEVYNDPAAPLFSYSNIKGCGGSGDNWDTSFGTDGGGNIDADPYFVDASNPAGPDANFGTMDDGLRLTIDSNCIDAADGNAAPATDILGFGRFDVGSVDNNGVGEPNYADIGAYEFGVVGHSVVHFSGAIIAYEFKPPMWSEAFVEDYGSDILGPGDYPDPDTEAAIGDAVYYSFDGIAIPWGRRVIIYSGENFSGEVLLDKTGPAIINNVHWIDDPDYNVVMTDDWPEPLQSEFPQSVREWSKTEMNDRFGEDGWEHGSFKIE